MYSFAGSSADGILSTEASMQIFTCHVCNQLVVGIDALITHFDQHLAAEAEAPDAAQATTVVIDPHHLRTSDLGFFSLNDLLSPASLQVAVPPPPPQMVLPDFPPHFLPFPYCPENDREFLISAPSSMLPPLPDQVLSITSSYSTLSQVQIQPPPVTGDVGGGGENYNERLDHAGIINPPPPAAAAAPEVIDLVQSDADDDEEEEEDNENSAGGEGCNKKMDLSLKL